VYASFVSAGESTAWQSPDESYTALDVYGVYERLDGTLPKGRLRTHRCSTKWASRARNSSLSRTSSSGMSFWLRCAAR
jgi:hypothetical protein